MSHLIGIDLGTSGTKTVLFDETGKVIASDLAEYPLSQPRNGWAEQDPEDWWRAVRTTVRAVLAKSGVAAKDVKGIGISGTLSTRTISGLSDTSDYAVGDYVALANQSPVPQLPDEWMMLLRFYTLRRIQIAAGYMQDAGATQMLIQEKEQDLISLISPRLDGQPNIIPANEIFGGNGYNW